MAAPKDEQEEYLKVIFMLAVLIAERQSLKEKTARMYSLSVRNAVGTFTS